MGKLEAAGEILARINPQQTSEKPQTPHSSETLRQGIIEDQIRRIYTSARQAPPVKGSASLRLEVLDAMRLWKGIPTEKIPDAVDMAIVAAGNFPATNGGVAKAWEFRRGKETLSDFAALGTRDRNDEKRFLEAPGAKPPTEEEKAMNKEEFRRIQQMLGPGTRPEGWGA